MAALGWLFPGLILCGFGIIIAALFTSDARFRNHDWEPDDNE